jgi:hypothetical protein
MIHVLVLMDRPGAADLRARVRPEHKAYLARVADRIAFAGPLLADDGETMIGQPARDRLRKPRGSHRLAGRRAVHARPRVCKRAGARVRQPLAAARWFSAVGEPVIKHIVMWRVRGDTRAERHAAARAVQRAFENLRGRIPGMRQIEVGIDVGGADYACDVVLVSVFETADALAAYAAHPEHERVRNELGDLRVSRHQVDYAVAPADAVTPTLKDPSHARD